MKPVKASDFPALRRVLTGYLHEDFLADYGTPADALRAFRDDASAVERQRLAKDAKKFLDRTEALEFSEVQALLHRLGCRWAAPSREALVALLEAQASSRSISS